MQEFDINRDYSYKIPADRLPADPKERRRIENIVRLVTVFPGGCTTLREYLSSQIKIAEEAIRYIDDAEGILIRGCDEGPHLVHIKILRKGINA